MSTNQLRWLPSFRSLSDEQRAVINDAFEGSSLVYGPAGSGKTAIALYRAKSLLDQGKSIQIFVFTNVLYRFIQAAANDLGIPTHCIQTFYKWVRDQHKDLIGYPPNEGGDEKFSRWTDAVIAHFQRNPWSKPHYDYVIVDEGQDFRGNVAQLIHLLSDNIFVAGDTSQSLYTDLRSMNELRQRWAPLDRPHFMIKNYRNPRAVARAAALFLDASPLSQEQFLQTVVGRPTEMKPVWYQVSSASERTGRIIEIMQQARGGVSIGVLFRHREQLREEADRLRAQGIPIQIALSGRDYHYNFENVSIPTLTTSHSAKGIEFDWVILPDLDEDNWDTGRYDPKQRRLFFVALTRTKNRLYLISQTGRQCGYVQEIVENDSGLLQIPGQPFEPTAPSRTYDFEDDALPF